MWRLLLLIIYLSFGMNSAANNQISYQSNWTIYSLQYINIYQKIWEYWSLVSNNRHLYQRLAKHIVGYISPCKKHRHSQSRKCRITSASNPGATGIQADDNRRVTWHCIKDWSSLRVMGCFRRLGKIVDWHTFRRGAPGVLFCQFIRCCPCFNNPIYLRSRTAKREPLRF